MSVVGLAVVVDEESGLDVDLVAEDEMLELLGSVEFGVCRSGRALVVSGDNVDAAETNEE